MVHLQPLEELTRRYASQEVERDAFVERLSEMAARVSESDEVAAQGLMALAWGLVSEFDRGDRAERSVRRELLKALESIDAGGRIEELPSGRGRERAARAS